MSGEKGRSSRASRFHSLPSCRASLCISHLAVTQRKAFAAPAHQDKQGFIALEQVQSISSVHDTYPTDLGWLALDMGQQSRAVCKVVNRAKSTEEEEKERDNSIRYDTIHSTIQPSEPMSVFMIHHNNNNNVHLIHPSTHPYLTSSSDHNHQTAALLYLSTPLANQIRSALFKQAWIHPRLPCPTSLYNTSQSQQCM